jgi:hypothetical protein
MQVPRSLKIGLGAGLLAALALALAALPGQAVDNSTRVDAGPPIEVRVNEGFDVVVAGYFEDPPAVEALEFYWDTDNRTDTVPHEGNPTNDQDVFGATFHFAGFDRVGSWAFTLWVNYSDGKLVNSTRVINVVENQLPVITAGLQPSGVVDSPVTFAVSVNDPDSVESTLQYHWDFDVGYDSDGDGVPDNDIQSTAKTNVVWSYTAEGTYTAKLTVTDDYGAEAVAYINAVITRPPGVCLREVTSTQVGVYFTENVTVRKLCWASYAIKVTAGRNYAYTVEVANGVPVFVMVQFGKDQFETYKVRGSTQAYVTEWSTVPNNVTSVTMNFRPTEDGLAYVTIDNGFLFGLDPGRESSVVVTVQDADRNNLLANIPIWVPLVAVAAVIGVVGFIFGRAYLAGAETRRLEREKRALETQEKAQAQSDLELFLQNPDEAMQRKTAPPPPPVPAAAPGAPAAAAPQARGPRAAGPQAPAGYVPPPPAPAPAPVPAPPPTSGPRPQAGPQPQPAAAAMACPSCQTPTEAGWSICPNCGSNL